MESLIPRHSELGEVGASEAKLRAGRADLLGLFLENLLHYTFSALLASLRFGWVRFWTIWTIWTN